MRGVSNKHCLLTFFIVPLFGAAYAAPYKGTTILYKLYPRYEVYRRYTVFAFSVIMFVCLSVGLSVCKLFFLSKISKQLLYLGF